MKSRNRRIALIAAALGASLALIGCERKTETAAKAPAAAEKPADALPADLFLGAAPEGAREVGDLKADAAASGAVVVRGRIGGRREPFFGESAMFLLVDARVKTCKELHGDSCPTPWDYCCEAKDSLLANTATVQIVGADGRPLRAALAGVSGLDPMREVVITGEIAPRESNGTLVINAKGIYVQPAGG